MRSRLSKTATLGSQLLNVWIFNGSEDETISGRAWREGALGGDPVWKRRQERIDWLFQRLPIWGHADHCQSSHEVDLHNAAPFCALLHCKES